MERDKTWSTCAILAEERRNSPGMSSKTHPRVTFGQELAVDQGAKQCRPEHVQTIDMKCTFCITCIESAQGSSKVCSQVC